MNQTTEETFSTPAEIEDAVLAIRHSTILRIERMQAYTDGAMLAVEQVQDTRLRLTEQPFQATASDALFAGIITAILESNIAGAILVNITRKIVAPTLRAAGTFRLLPNVMNRKNVSAFVKRLRGTTERITLSQARELAQLEGAQFNTLCRYAAALTRRAPDYKENMVAGAKAIYATYEKSGGIETDPPLELDPEDTAGVSVLAAAQQFASYMRIMELLHAAGLESVARTGLMTKQDLGALVDTLQWEILEEDLRSTRGRYKLMHEAIIWAKLYGFDGANITGSAQLRGIDSRLVEYFIKRFAKPIEEWSRTNPVGSPAVGQATQILALRDGTFLKQKEARQVSFINQYFAAMGRGVPQDPSQFRSAT